MISKALAGSLLVAASMSASATTTPITVTFGVLPALTIATTTAFAPGTNLTGAIGSVCTWTPTLVAPTATAPVVTDVTTVRSGTGCPDLTESPVTALTVGTYTVTAAGAADVDVQITLQSATVGDLTYAPAGVGVPEDGSTAGVALVADTPSTVNLGANATAYIYLGGETTVGAAAVTVSTDVDFNIVAVY